jgi:rRNA maturation endonuclease Nob1
MNPSALQASFVQDFMPAVLPDVVSSQVAAASIGARGMAENVGGQGVRVNAAAFAGAASDGGSLTHLLAQPLIQTYGNLDAGMAPKLAMSSGFDSMDRILTTQVHDAARSAAQVQLVTSKDVTYYVRIVEPGACSRCLLLAGRRYRWSRGFLRHPQCRCHMAPETVQSADTTPSPWQPEPSIRTPEDVFDSLTPAQQDAAFGKANAEAIRRGADITKVVNATGSRNGMSTTITDPYGRSLKGTRNDAVKGRDRLVPESILQLAGDDRDEALRLLRAHGYVTSRPNVQQRAEARAVAKAKADAEAAKARRAEAVAARRAAAKAERDALRATPDSVLEDELAQQFEMDAPDDARIDTITNELDRRQDARNLVDAKRQAKAAASEAEQQRQSDEIGRLILEEGMNEVDAVAEVTGVRPDLVAQRVALRNLVNTYPMSPKARVSFVRASNAAYEGAELEQQVIAIEAYSNGNTVTALGARKGYGVSDLLKGSRAFAERYASPEVKEYWDAHGRMTPQQFSADQLRLARGESPESIDTGEAYLR